MADVGPYRDESDSPRRRLFVAVATTEYEGGWSPLLAVADEVVRFRDWLCSEQLGDRGFVHIEPALAHNPDLSDIEAALKRPPSIAWRETDAVVLLLAGHGEKNEEWDEHYIILKNTESAALATTALSTNDLLKWLRDTRLEHLFLVIDACYAGLIEEHIFTRSRPLPPGWVILPSAQKYQTSELGALTRAVTTFLEVLQKDEGAKFTRGPYLRVDEFVRFINETLGLAQQVKPISGSAPGSQHLCLPNPHYDAREFSLPRRDLDQHWSLRGRGLETQGETGWFFTERPALMRRLLDWLDAPPQPIVLTGAAGTGKSAALAGLVILSDPVFRVQYADDLNAIDPELRPVDVAVDVAVFARGKLSTEVLAQVLRACNVPIPKQDQIENTIDHGLARWHSWLRDQPDPITIVVDALDEAVAPTDLLVLLTRLEPDTDRRRIRLIVGVRSIGGANSAAVSDPSRLPLAELAAARLGADMLHVDRHPLWDEADMQRYIVKILRQTDGSPYSGIEVDDLGAAIRRWSGRSFLLAHEAARWLASRCTVLTAEDLPRQHTLGNKLIEIVRANVIDSYEEVESRRRAVALLRTIAFGRGRGLPWFRLWPELTSELDIEHPEAIYGDEEIVRLLRSRLAGYLVADQESDAPAYRLFHDELRIALRTDWQRLLGEPGEAHDSPDNQPASDLEIRSAEATITRTLLRLAEPALERGSRRKIDPYIRRHLAEHAADAGRLDSRHLPDNFLPYADPWRLRAAAARTRDADLRRSLPLLPVVRRVMHLWDWESPARNAAAIQMWAALDQITGTAVGPSSWEVLWAIGPEDDGLILGRAPSDVWTVATTSLSDQGAVAITGSAGAPVVWDLDADIGGAPFRGSGHQGAINALAVARLGEHEHIVVTGGDDAAVRLWDLTTRVAIRAPMIGHRGKIRALATTVLRNGTAIAVTGGADKTVRRWDLNRGCQLGEPLTGHDGAVTSLATWVRSDGTPIAVTGSTDQTIRVWDLDTGSPIGQPFIGHRGTISAIVIVELPTGLFAISAVRDAEARVKDRTIRRWDLGPTAAHTVLTTTPAGTLSMASIGGLDGRFVIATGHENATIRLADAQTGESIGEPLHGHSGTVPAIAVAHPGTGAVLISGGNDSSVRAWELDEFSAGHTPDSRNVDTPEAVHILETSTGPFVVVTTVDNDVELWDIHTGTPTGRRFRGATAAVQTITSGRLADDTPVLIAGTWDATVLIWNLDTGALAIPPLRGHRGPVHTVDLVPMPDGSMTLITGGWDAVWTWDPASGRKGSCLVAEQQSALATVLFADSGPQALVGYPDGRVTAWDIVSREPLDLRVEPAIAAITSLSAADLPDGRTVAAIGDAAGGVRVIDVRTGAAAGPRIEVHPGGVTALTIAKLSAQELMLITADLEPTVRCWDIQSGHPIGAPLPVPHAVRAMAVRSEDRPLLLLGGTGVTMARLLHGMG